MEELEVEPLPRNQTNFILWVDDKTGEGKKYWSQVQNIDNSTVMHRLFKQNNFKNGSVSMIPFSNMQNK